MYALTPLNQEHSQNRLLMTRCFCQLYASRNGRIQNDISKHLPYLFFDSLCKVCPFIIYSQKNSAYFQAWVQVFPDPRDHVHKLRHSFRSIVTILGFSNSRPDASGVSTYVFSVRCRSPSFWAASRIASIVS
ncbi:MAG: hypothetical protein MPEBLZ_01400 [Candidatus Methanoperedens nitroreducens]|uniref:Uncharacterized protein n=1 Tax=Candidatus Methanoperedens nitratireducens TaxID=1392998 RepID=A0A0P8ABL1_9EURY|nr:MAG: hypothetical protein MPEBLZ_01400 [Candidatus Methanoperedens sp. BLZ1]